MISGVISHVKPFRDYFHDVPKPGILVGMGMFDYVRANIKGHTPENPDGFQSKTTPYQYFGRYEIKKGEPLWLVTNGGGELDPFTGCFSFYEGGGAEFGGREFYATFHNGKLRHLMDDEGNERELE